MGYALDNLRVLVVDQNEHIRHLLQTILQTVGARTIDLSSSDGAGFETYRRYEYDLVITDSGMEPLSGFKLVDLIRISRQSPNPYVPIIMLSAHSDEERIRLARDHGVTEFLAKPVTVDIVLKRVEAVIENPRPFVRTGAYFGPERRRKSSFGFAGPERRMLKPEKVVLSAQDITNQRRLALTQHLRNVDELARN